MNIFRDIILRFLIIPECIKKFLSFFMQYQSFFPSFTKKNYMNELWTIFVQYHTECMLETSKFTVLRSSTLLESIKLSARTLDAEHRERLTLFFFPFPLSSLLFFFSRKKRMYRAREKINHLAWLFKLARWNCRFRQWFRVPADFHSEKSRHPLLRSLPLVILTLSCDR